MDEGDEMFHFNLSNILFMSGRKIWTVKEDEALRRIGSESQAKNWSELAKRLSRQFGFKKRTGKQCRERWYNHLDPQITKNSWTAAEEQRMLALHMKYGNKWTLIAEEMTGRSDNSIKNYFYSTVRRNLRRMSKYCGSKNSTGLMREIKPSTMTRIFGSLNEYLQSQGLTKDFLRESCQNIRDEIIKFSSFKPKKNDKISQQQKRKYHQVFWLIKKVNQIYEKIKNEEKNNQTEKQLFRHYYQEMNRQSSDQPMQSESQLDQEIIQSQQEQQIMVQREVSLHTNQLRTSKKVQVISLSKPLSPESINMMRSSGQIEQKAADSNPQPSNNHNHKTALQSTLQNIVQYAQQIEFHDPQFNIQIGEQRQKTSEANNLQMIKSGMSFKSPAFGTPVSQVNFFKSPRSNKISCLADYLMRMSNSNKQEFCLGSSGEVKQAEKEWIAKRQA